MENDGKIKILLDTDIGSDIDDALCLAYLLSQPRCELLGITTVSGEPEKRAMLADAICLAAGCHDIPIHSGSPEPLLVPQHQPLAQQAEVLAGWEHRRYEADYTAIAFLQRTIRQYPGEITLLAIGPLTNIGLLFAMDPEIPGMLKRLVMMLGLFSNRLSGVGPLEWNALCDPHAAAIVYRAAPADCLSIGLDVTCQCVLPAEEARRRMRGGPLAPVAEMAEVWFRGRGDVTFHDPLAAAAIFAPDLLEFERGRVEVETISQRLLGLTHWLPSKDGPHQAAFSVAGDRFLRHYFETVG